jgi:hypothetical protein
VTDQFDAKAFLKTVTSQPGVYRMYDTAGTVIYVGKAKDLKKGFPATSVVILRHARPKRWSRKSSRLMSR